MQMRNYTTAEICIEPKGSSELLGFNAHCTVMNFKFSLVKPFVFL